jgi:hypothetical protein
MPTTKLYDPEILWTASVLKRAVEKITPSKKLLPLEK